MHTSSRIPALVALPLLALTVTATAVSANGINLPVPAEPVFVDPAPARAYPSVFGVNSAFPPVGGTGYVAYTHVDPRDGIAGSDQDGQLSFGYTIGSPIDNVSVTLQANITGLDPFGDSGNFNISLARALNVSDRSLTFIGASVGGLGAFGTATVNDEGYSVYVSHLVELGGSSNGFPLQATVGYGTQVERASDGSGLIDEGFFYGVGVGVTPNLSLSASGTTTQFNLGGAMTFDALPGFSLSGGVYDVTNETDRQQVSVTAAFSF